MNSVTKVRGRIDYQKVAEVRKEFRKYDLDRSGGIDGQELGLVLRGLGLFVEPYQVDLLLEAMDQDGSGRIEDNEFIFWYPTFQSLHRDNTVAINPKTGILPKRGNNAPSEFRATGAEEGTGVDWDQLRQKLPIEKNAAEKARRAELFAQFDPNGNGYLSLAEIDKGFRDVVRLEEVFSCKPVIMRAYQAARGVSNKRKGEDYRAKKNQSVNGSDYVEKSEFRLLLWYVRQYFELWQMFSMVDTSDDRRITQEEFTAMFHSQLSVWGAGRNGQDETAEETFRRIDRNSGGFILFDEFASWALEMGLDLVEDDED